MRTTLNIDDDLYRQVKASAALRGCSVTSLVEEALRHALLVREVDSAVAPLPVSTRGGGMTKAFLATGIDLNDVSSVLDYLDASPE